MADFNQDSNDDDKSVTPSGQNLLGGWAGSRPIKEPRCHVCTSKFRAQIDHEILLGHSHTLIAKRYSLDYGDEKITRASVMQHAKRHLTVEDAAIRKIIEERAAEENESVAEAVGILLGQRSVLEIIAYKGYKSVVSGETTVEVKDLLNVLKDIRSMEGAMVDVEKDEMKADFGFFVQSVKEIAPEDMWERIADRFNEKKEGKKPKLLDQLIDLSSLGNLDEIIEGELEDE